MIRINLLPQTGKSARVAGPTGSGQLWAGIYLFAVVVWGIGLAVLYISFQSTLEEQKQANSTLDAEIQRLETKSARLEEVRSQLDASKQLEEVVAELNRARTGPTRLMLELSKVLSVGPGSGPTIDPQRLEQLRHDNPHAGFNAGWDVHRLWLTSFTENNRECTMRGTGRTNEDVAEFLRRLALSDLFESVTLERTQAQASRESGLDFINFELTCKVRY